MELRLPIGCALWIVSTLSVAQVRTDLLDKYALQQWDRQPIGGTSMVGFRLCEVPHSDPCIVIAEMKIYLPQTPLVSLDEDLARWQTRHTDSPEVIEGPSRTELKGQPAIEVATRGRHSDHIAKIVVHETFAFQAGDGYVKCYGNASPDEYFAFKPVFRDFCSSFDLSTLKPD